MASISSRLLRARPRHFDQNRVMQNDEGRLLLLAGDFEALGFERRQQSILLRRQGLRPAARSSRIECFARRHRVFGLPRPRSPPGPPHAGLAPVSQGNLAAQGQGRLAREHGAAAPGQNPTVAIIRVLSDEIPPRGADEKCFAIRRGLNSLPTPKVGRRSWPCRLIASVVRPTSRFAEMARKEPPRRAVDGRHDLLRRDGAVEDGPAAIADIAIAARLGRLAESGEQGLAPAARRFAQGDQRIELARLHPLALLRRVALGNLPLAQKNVGVAEQSQRFGAQSVAPGAADLLIIGLDALRQIGVADEADIGLVDAHAEGDRGDDDDAVVVQELILMGRSDRRLEPRMIGKRRNATLAEAAS